MNRKSIILGLVAVASCVALGYGEKTVSGAWALEANPGKTCLVVTNKTAWVLRNGGWIPSSSISEKDRGVYFNPIGESSSERHVLWHPSKDWERKVLASEGIVVRKGDVVWAREGQRNNRIVYLDGHRMVRAKMPDWSKIRNEKKYLGFWKPVRSAKTRESGGAPTQIDGKCLVKIRDDRIIVLYMKGRKPTKDVPEPYKIEAWAPIEGGLRFDYREHYATYDDPLNCMVRGLWIDPEGSLVCYSDDETTTLVRTDEMFDDPINTRRKMVTTKSFHGVWGVNVEFNIMILGFDRSGKGYMSGFMSLVPFEWSVRGNGTIRCVPDPDMVLVFGARHIAEFCCRYDPVKNEMVAEFPPNEDEGEIDPTRKVLPFMTWKIRTAEIFSRIDAFKKSPQWRRELERARNRPPETQEERDKRLRRAEEKRRARISAAKERAAREEEEAKKKKWFQDVLDHYDQVVRNEAYYSETNLYPACYLQDNLFRSNLGSDEDNHVVIKHIQANPKLLARYYNVAVHENLLQEDIDWLFKTFLADYLQNKNPRYMERLISGQYKRLTISQYEEAFQKLQDDDLLKMKIHAEAYHRDRKFHPDWRFDWRRARKK